jgi:hypothetical protein
MMETLCDLSENAGNQTRCQVTTLTRFRQLVQVTFHALKDKVQLFGIWLKKGIVERNDGGMLRDIT